MTQKTLKDCLLEGRFEKNNFQDLQMPRGSEGRQIGYHEYFVREIYLLPVGEGKMELRLRVEYLTLRDYKEHHLLLKDHLNDPLVE